VSWNLMLGKNPLWVAKQHGHSIETMLRVYAAWADGAVEADAAAIARSMVDRPAVPTRAILVVDLAVERAAAGQAAELKAN
jgi:integrase